MPLPNEPITLSAEQIDEFNRKLTNLRHDVNNCLSLMFAALELLRRQRGNSNQLIRSLAEQPLKIEQVAAQFLSDLDAAVRVNQP